MWSGSQTRSSPPNKNKQEIGRGLSESFRVENFIPGLIIGFICGLFLDISSPNKTNVNKKKIEDKHLIIDQSEQELKMVFVVRQDLKMGPGKIASQCAHAATGIYAELMRSHRLLLGQWEQCGQPKIVVTCKNLVEMNGIKEVADNIFLPTFMVSDAGKTQVAAGSKTVLVIGPGPKAAVNSVTGKLRLL